MVEDEKGIERIILLVHTKNKRNEYLASIKSIVQSETNPGHNAGPGVTVLCSWARQVTLIITLPLSGGSL